MKPVITDSENTKLQIGFVFRWNRVTIALGRWCELARYTTCCRLFHHAMLPALVLSAAGRGAVQVAAHEHCVLGSTPSNKHLHFKNSVTRLFRQLVMAREVIVESCCLVQVKHWIHSCFQQQVAV